MDYCPNHVTMLLPRFVPTLKRAARMNTGFHCTVIYRTFVSKSDPVMEIPLSKDERLDLRLSAEDKELFRLAQKLSGDKSISSFILRIVKKQAEEIVIEKERIIASERDRKVFFDAVFGNSMPNQHLIAAAKRYNSRTKQP